MANDAQTADDVIANAAAIVHGFEAQSGIKLDDHQLSEVTRSVIDGGFTDQAVAQAFAEHVGVQIGMTDAGDMEFTDTAGEPHLDNDLFQRDLAYHVERLEKDLGRSLLRSERKAVTEKATDHATRHLQMDENYVTEALEEHHRDTGFSDMSKAEQRRARMTQRLREDLNPDPEDDESLDNLDLSKFDDRVKYLTAKAEGVEFEVDKTSHEPSQEAA